MTPQQLKLLIELIDAKICEATTRSGDGLLESMEVYRITEDLKKSMDELPYNPLAAPKYDPTPA